MGSSSMLVPLVICAGVAVVVALGAVGFVLWNRRRTSAESRESQPEPQPEPRATGKQCPSCGAWNPKDYIFCDRCGERL